MESYEWLQLRVLYSNILRTPYRITTDISSFRINRVMQLLFFVIFRTLVWFCMKALGSKKHCGSLLICFCTCILIISLEPNMFSGVWWSFNSSNKIGSSSKAKVHCTFTSFLHLCNIFSLSTENIGTLPIYYLVL
jgi:hypothetical protein